MYTMKGDGMLSRRPRPARLPGLFDRAPQLSLAARMSSRRLALAGPNDDGWQSLAAKTRGLSVGADR